MFTVIFTPDILSRCKDTTFFLHMQIIYKKNEPYDSFYNRGSMKPGQVRDQCGRLGKGRDFIPQSGYFGQ